MDTLGIVHLHQHFVRAGLQRQHLIERGKGEGEGGGGGERERMREGEGRGK
jgi:hypothetical protein